MPPAKPVLGVRMRLRTALVGWSLLLALPGLALAQTQISQPKQPHKGPGGQDYAHAAVAKLHIGLGADACWLYTPAEPVPLTAPVVVFLHGWGGMDPVSYGAWIEHLVRKGSIVIYPRYQADLLTPPGEMTEHALNAVNSALALLEQGETKPDRERLAIIGHSLGAVIGANLACEAMNGWMPQPKALMLIEPGDSKNSNIARAFGVDERVPSILRDYSAIPADTLMLCIVAEEDFLAGKTAARNIFYRATGIARGNKDFVTVFSDRRGNPPLVANHLAPLAPSEAYREEIRKRLWDRLRDRLGKTLPIAREMEGATTDALDWYCFWRLADALMTAAFTGEHREEALGGGFEQKFMGKWSDGVPVKPLAVTDSP